MTMSAFGTAGRSHGKYRFGGGPSQLQTSLARFAESTNWEAKIEEKYNYNSLNLQCFSDE